MRRKILSLALAFVLVITLLPITAQAEDSTEGTAVNISNHEIEKLGDEINGYMKTNNISTYSAITSLCVSGGTINYKDRKFLYDSGMSATLKKVNFSKTSIDYTEISDYKADNPNELPSYAFGNWYALTSIELPDNVTKIAKWAVNNCPELKTVSLPHDLNTIDYAAFTYMPSATQPAITDIYTTSPTPPSSLHPNAFMYVAEGAVLHVPDGSGNAWDSKDINLNDGKIFGLQIENMAPIIAHAETRTTDSTAEIDLYSNEPGCCYYTLVKDGVTAPAIDTSGEGFSFDSSNMLALPLTGLEPGVAYDIYLKAKDLLNNVTELIKIDLNVYVPMLDVVINNHTSGSLQTELDGYFSAHGYPAEYEKIRSLTVSDGALNIADFEVFQNAYQMAYVTQWIDLSKTSVQSIPDDTFKDYNLAKISLPSDIVSIGASAFEDCGHLTEITISASTPPAVGTDAFAGVATNAAVHVPAGCVTAYKAVNDGNTTDNLWYGLTVVALESTDPGTGGGSGGSGSGGGSHGGSHSTSATTYKAEVKDGTAESVALPVIVDTVSKTGMTSMEAAKAKELFSKNGAAINMPSIPNVSAYKLDLPATALSGTQGSGSITLSTNVGSLTISSNMLSMLTETDGKKAGITIGQGDKTKLTREEKAAVGDRPLIQLTLTINGEQTNWSNPNAAVTVSIPYKPTAAELVNPECIIIWYLDGSGKPVCIPNGHYDPATGMVTFTAVHFSCYAIGFDSMRFSDVTESSWFNKAVSFLSAREITTGTGGGNFSPYAKLTRGEFLVMLMRAYGIEPDKNPQDNFSDAGSTYYTEYLAAAKRLNISDGVGGNLYAPEKAITRQEMFALLHNTLKAINKLPKGTADKSISSFSDNGEIASWAKEAISILIETGIINGNGGKLSPASTANRAELAQILYNLILE